MHREHIFYKQVDLWFCYFSLRIPFASTTATPKLYARSRATSLMATFASFANLPLEIQILVFRFYYPKWAFDITVSQSPEIPANFRIGTGCPFKFLFRAAGRRGDLCALWTSPDLYEAAHKALEQSFTGKARLHTAGKWHFSQRKPMFCAFVLPGLPARKIKTITLSVGEPSIASALPTAARDYLTWKELIDFMDFERMPNLECLEIRVSLFGRLEFRIDQIGNVLQGMHDHQIMEQLQQTLPKVGPGSQRQISSPSGRTVMVRVFTEDPIEFWVPKTKPGPHPFQRAIVVSDSDLLTLCSELCQKADLWIRIACDGGGREYREPAGEVYNTLFGISPRSNKSRSCCRQ